MRDDTDIFFAPRVIHTQPRLEFASVPPTREVAFPCEGKDFVGMRLHWCDGVSRLCEGFDRCRQCQTGNPSRDYFYAAAYVLTCSRRNVQPAVLPIGNDLTGFANVHLQGRSWKVYPKQNAKGKKAGLALAELRVPGGIEIELPELPMFDIRPRLLKRFQ
jgi:hypothetical protein